MTYEQYWYNSDYQLYWAYYDAYKIKIKAKRDYDNQLAWLSGLYIRNAVGSVFGGEEYPEAIDFVEMDRWNALTEQEKNEELRKQAVENSKAEFARVKALLEAQKNK